MLTLNLGFVYAGPPRLDGDLISLIIPQAPIIIIILVIEHIAIAKNFGKQFGYEVVPSQEIMAQGTANMLGPFLGGYSCTGSFGASAVLSKAAVRTPLAGLFSALMLLLALYALTSVFYYIPRAALAGLIIHAVINLVASPKVVMKYWHFSPFECVIWVIGVIMAVFTGLETSIYITIGLSLLVLLVRLARTNGTFLGRVPIQQTSVKKTARMGDGSPGISEDPDQREHRDVYLALNRKDASNPDIVLASPHPGVFVYHFPEGFNYLNQALHLKTLTDYVYAQTRRTTPPSDMAKHDALWCDASTLSSKDMSLPILKAIVIDCSTINNIDITSVQGLVDARNALDRWASPSPVDWHFGGLRNRWSRRALATAGFGRFSEKDRHSLGNWMPIYSLTTAFGGATEADVSSEIRRRGERLNADDESNSSGKVVHVVKAEDADSEASSTETPVTGTISEKYEGLRPVFALDRPLFHADLEGAVEAAVANASSHSG